MTPEQAKAWLNGTLKLKQPRLTRRALLKVMVELLTNRKPASASFLAGYEAALRDVSDAFKLCLKDMGGKQC